jgi:hypothetical protein
MLKTIENWAFSLHDHPRKVMRTHAYSLLTGFALSLSWQVTCMGEPGAMESDGFSFVVHGDTAYNPPGDYIAYEKLIDLNKQLSELVAVWLSAPPGDGGYGRNHFTERRT